MIGVVQVKPVSLPLSKYWTKFEALRSFDLAVVVVISMHPPALQSWYAFLNLQARKIVTNFPKVAL